MAPKRCTEFIFQIAAMVSTAGAFTAALYAEIRFKGLSSAERNIIQGISNVLSQNELFLKTEAVTGLAFASTGFAVIFGLFALIGRICHARHTRSNYRIFFCLYVLYIVACFLLFAGTGVLAVFTTIEWDDIADAVSGLTVVENIRNSIAATSACCFLVALLYTVLEVVLLCCCAAVKDY